MSKNILTKRTFLAGLATTSVAATGNDIPNLTQITALVKGLGIAKRNVRVTTDEADGNLILSGIQTIDGVLLSAGDRILVRHQVDSIENGIWVIVDGGAWTRAEDADESQELVNGTTVVPQEGTHADHRYMLTVDDFIVPGTDAQTWVHDISITGDAGDIVADDSNFGTITGTNVQNVLDSIDNELVDAHSLLGTSDVDLGAAQGDIIPANSDVKTATFLLESSAMASRDDADDLETLGGFGENAESTGAMGGTHTVDNSTIKANLLALDTEIVANQKVLVSGVSLTDSTWITVTHNLNDARLSAIAVYDTGDNNKLITDAVDIRPVAGNANAIEIYQASGSAVTVDVAMRK